MKSFAIALCFGFFAGVAQGSVLVGVAQGSAAVAKANLDPVSKVVSLLETLKEDIRVDGLLEQKIYDKYACWAEQATKRKSDAIDAAEAVIKACLEKIMTLTSEISTGIATIKNTKKEIQEIIITIRKAYEKHAADYDEWKLEKDEKVAAKNALEAAIKVLDTAMIQSGSKFLGTIQKGQALNVIAQLQSVLKNSEVVDRLSLDQRNELKDFVDHAATAGISLAQGHLKLNPFGDYAEKKNVILGILKQMLEGMIADIAKMEDEGYATKKIYEEITITRKTELDTLNKTRSSTEKDVRNKKIELIENKELRKAKIEQRDADKIFLEQTLKNARKEAAQWAARCAYRTEETQGIEEAIAILSAPDAKATFFAAGPMGRSGYASSFLQMSSDSVSSTQVEKRRNEAYLELKKLATGSSSLQMARIAAQLKLGGHFDAVIASIDKMIEQCRKQEAADIFHRDRCQNVESGNLADISDAEHDLQVVARMITALESKETELKARIDEPTEGIKAQMAFITQEMADQLTMRNEEEKTFKEAMKDDVDAMAVLDRAIQSLGKYYMKNKLELGSAFVQNATQNATVDDFDYNAPKTKYSDLDSKSSETGGIVAILQMIKEDLAKEVKTARLEHASSEEEFENGKDDQNAKMTSLKEEKAAVEMELASVENQLAAAESYKTAKSGDEKALKALKESIYADCEWSKTHFDSRFAKRKAEIDGLTKAKSYLSGIAKDEIA